MELKSIIAALDEEISRLEKVRSLLEGTNGHATKAATSFAFSANEEQGPRKRGKLSAEARARIAAAQKARWAAQKKAAK